MILDAKQHGARGMLVNVDTGRPIWWARKADLATGEFEAFRADPAEAKRQGIPLRSLLYRGRARLKFVPAAPVTLPVPSAVPEVQAPAPAKPRRRGVRLGWSPDCGCQAYGCIRDAEWAVATEEARPPVVGANGKRFEAAKLVSVHFFCSWHYQWPAVLCPDGSTAPIETVRARPD